MPATLNITKLHFKSGSTATSSPLILDANNITVIVGPNNSGKSLALREIEGWCIGNNNPTKVISNVDLDLPTISPDLMALVQPFMVPPPNGAQPMIDHVYVHKMLFNASVGMPGSGSRAIHLPTVLSSITEEPTQQYARQNLSNLYTIRLDGRTRFSLAESKPSGDLQESPQNHLWKLFKDDTARNEVRSLSEDAFGLHFVIDPTAMTQFRIRMSDVAPKSALVEQGLGDEARAFHAAAPEIKDLSDGVQAFIGLTSALLSLPHKIILIDEPEAFLHPPLSRRLGANMARLSHKNDGSLVVSTHSADFVMGCLETASSTQIVRLTYQNGLATARALLASDLHDIVKDPLLRSTGVLRALFHRAVIVTESDTDRVFYDEINNRLLQNNRGVKDCLFVNGQNKQTLQRVIAPLRKIGIPAVAIPDLDIIKVSQDLTKLMKACYIPASTQSSLQNERAWLFNILDSLTKRTSIDKFKKGGLSLLSGADLTRANQFLTSLAEYGIFVVPNGEIETWLSSVGISSGKHGAEWLIAMFDGIGQTETDANYLKPSSDDIWMFIDQINTWIENPNKLGLS